MQGQRGSVGSLPETLDFDLGTPSNNATMDQQICWNSMRNPAENRMPDYLIAPSDMNIALVNSRSRERPNLSRWCLNEASSSNTHGEASQDERKTELGWPSSSGPRLEEQRHEPANNSSADNNANLMFVQSSNHPDAISSSLNLGFVGRSSVNTNNNNSQIMEFPNSSYKFGGSENEQSRSVSVSDPFLLPSGSAGFMVGENDGRQEGRRMSCKRKAIEGNVGPSSSSGSCSYFQHTESSARPGLSAQNNAGSSLSMYPSLEQGNPRLELGGISITSDRPESSHRNFRLRTNPSNQQNPVSPPIFSTGRNVRRSSVMPPQPSPSPLQASHSLDLRPPSAVDNMRNQSQPAMIDNSLPQNVQPLRWNGASTSRNGGSSSAVDFGERDVLPREDLSSRSFPRNILDHPIFVPATELRNVVRHPSNRSLAGGSTSIPGNSASTSRAGSSSNVHPSSAPVWPPHHNSPHYPRRFSEYLRRSLFSSVGAESGGQSGSYLPLRPGLPGSSQEMLLPTGAGNQGHHLPHPRSASWMERHSNNGLGIQYSLRSLGAAGEGSSRLVSEIRNVLGLMRRGENLRFEDVMILDPSVFVGVADIHDRHRDMRLDVDNMSYEELLALEERIGNVSTGLSEEMILKCLKQKKYTAAGKFQSENEPCSICQEEYNEGENVGRLDCGHDFHRDCIKQWLTQKNLCPICKTTALQT
ncbi:E3 ubiquitin ligase BIG BROTHER [Morus notabilis]|uniref:RING-type E3 ubiquitin transferase n=1 Tax=Morus notabilis TaxID=981085 RepID=W9S6D9_9ROSA|nr:probable E3 ubiquitin-protein ligase RHG1A isoform X2 [Morus notabilis]EXC28188.1 E3 ubiquitin ligase BIG BROTHER [Morus notabilis]